MRFAFATTGFITVRIAARPVSFTWRKKVGAETIRTELKASGDPRVRAGVRAALEHIGARHGLSKSEQQELADQVDGECCKGLAEQPENARYCDVVIDESEARLEVKVRVAGRDSRNAHLRAANSTKHNESRNSDNGRRCATFVKHFHKTATHS